MPLSRLFYALLISSITACGGGSPAVAEAAPDTSTPRFDLVRTGGGSNAMAVVDVLAERVNAEPAALLLGTHSLWWEMTSPWIDGTQAHPVLAQMLKSASGPMRFGGAANEADWTVCGNTVSGRSAVVVASWSGALTCKFGWQEYADLMRSVGGSSAWMIANVVGNAGGEYTDGELRARMAAAASRLAQLTPGMARTWELGNELERGKVRWPPEKIAARLLVAAAAARSADPSARLVFPLTEYDPPGWTRKAFNEALLKNLGTSFTDFAVHQYYDGSKGGPAVRTQVMNLREIAALVDRQVGSRGGLWITEHGRWPDGLPEDGNWKANWWRTSSMSGTRSTADYLIALSQLPSVRGAMLHGLRAGPWNAVQMGSAGPKLSGPGLLLQTFGQSGARWRLKTQSAGIGMPAEWAAYQARVAAFETDVPGEYVLWGVNVSTTDVEARLRFDGAARQVQPVESTVIACAGLTAECASDRIVATARTHDAAEGFVPAPVLLMPSNTVIALKVRVR